MPPRKGAQSWFSGEHVLTLRDGTLNARTLPEGRVVATVSVPEDTRYATANPELSRFVVAGRRGAAVLDARGVVLAMLPHPASVNRAVFSPNGRRIATAGSDGKAIVWELDGRRVRTFDSRAEQAYDVGFDRHLATACRRVERRRRPGMGNPVGRSGGRALACERCAAGALR